MATRAAVQPLGARVPAASNVPAQFGRAAVGLIIVALTLLLVDRSRLISRLAKLDVRYVALGMLLALPQLGLCAWRWRVSARRLGLPLSMRQATREYGLSIFLNQVLPFGVAGDAVRVTRYARQLQAECALESPTAWRGALTSALVERSAGQLLLIALAALLAPLWFEAVPRLACIAALGGMLAGWLALRRLARVVAPAANGGRLAALRHALADLDRALLAPRALALQAALSSAILLTIVGQLCCALAALGLDLPTRLALQIFPPMLLAMALPFSFAGFGPREAATAALYHAAALTTSDGTAFSLAYGAMSCLAALPGALWFVASRR
jgi:uncharacterized membrane protein YbhN (UPF0104 family)